MKIDVKYLENQYCAPRDHPVTCSNPAPWKIEEVKITCQDKVWIRGKESMWFRLNDCILDTKDALEGWLEEKEEKSKERVDLMKKLEGYFENLSEEKYKEISDLVDREIEEEERHESLLKILK